MRDSAPGLHWTPDGVGDGGSADERAGVQGSVAPALYTRPFVYVAASLSLLAALIHLWVLPEHLLHWWGMGVFFLAAASLQGLYGVVLLRWSHPLVLLAGIAGNLGIAALYVLTHTSGIPVGPSAGMIEEPGLLGMMATAAEVGIIVALVASLEGAYRRSVVNVLLAVGVIAWLMWLTGVL